jgi:PhnB protein
MASKAKPIPDGFEGATPYLCCKDAARAIDFYKKAFGATEVMRMAEPGGRIGHAEIKIGAALIMLADEHPDFGAISPQSLGGTPVTIHVYVQNVDALVSQAAAAGAKVERPPTDQFYGDRSATLSDPCGHRWMLATHKEDVSPEEMRKRYTAMMQQQSGKQS